MFSYNDTLTFITSDDAGNFFQFSMIYLEENGTYIPAPIEDDNTTQLPLRNKTVQITSPLISFDVNEECYYLIYAKIYDGNFYYALAKTFTPLEATSWAEVGLFPYPTTAQLGADFEQVAIIWKTNDTDYNYLFFQVYANDLYHIEVIESEDKLSWQNESEPFLKNRKGLFDSNGIATGPNPVQLTSGDFLYLYTSETNVGYVILEKTNPLNILQRSDKAIFTDPNIAAIFVAISGLVQNPRGCPENTTEEFAPEFLKNIECFLGFYYTEAATSNFFDFFISWSDPDVTPPPVEATNPTTPTTTLTSASEIMASSTTFQQTTTSASEELLKSASSNPHLAIIIISSILVMLLIGVGACIVYYNKRKKAARNLLINLMKRQEISDKDAKVLAATVDKFELNSKQVSIDFKEKIGSGSTSTVYQGFLSGFSATFPQNCENAALKLKYSNCAVAVKVQKELNHSETEQIMQELQAMRRIGYHSHVSVLLGWCFHNDLPTLVMELAHQDLYTYVYSFRNTENTSLTLTEFLSIAWQISNGMEHVASYQIIHRDLATRNILLFDGLHVKIYDFGLCCICDETLTYDATLEKKLPVRWLSIEALIDKRFSEKSDVWAFGVLLYEMCTNGAVPYSLMSNHEIIEFLQSGSRLEKPENIAENDEIYDLMLDCWRESVEDRPPFSQISAKLECHLEGERKRYGYLSVEN